MEAVRPPLDAILSAQQRLLALVISSPAVPLHRSPTGVHISLKLENLQPVGCFKLHPVGNAVMSRPPAALARGDVTCNSGKSGMAGAGAIPVATAIAGRHPYKSVCAVLSGGNSDDDMLSTILAGYIYRPRCADLLHAMSLLRSDHTSWDLSNALFRCQTLQRYPR
jgi:threonine dehydratase